MIIKQEVPTNLTIEAYSSKLIVEVIVANNQGDGRDVKIKKQNTFSTHESLYSTINGFRNLEISSIYTGHKKHIRNILNHIHKQYHVKQWGQQKLL